MKIAQQIARFVLAIPLLVFGSNKFIGFLEMPTPEDPQIIAYFTGLFGSYLKYLLATTEITVGLLLVINKYVPLALLILAPVSLNILMFHLTMDPAGGMVGYLVFLLNAYLLYVNKESYGELLKA